MKSRVYKTAIAMLFLLSAANSNAELSDDTIIATNSFRQTGDSGLNYFMKSVGIGTATPSSKLHVRSVSNSVVDFVFIPHTSPAVPVGGSTLASVLTTSGSSNGSFHVGIEVPANDLNDGFYVITDSDFDGLPDTVAMKIRADGFIGVGTNQPGARLHVAGDLKVDGAIQTDDNEKLYFGAGDDYSITFDGGDAVHTLTSGDLVFTGGNVGIGTSAPDAPLEISSASPVMLHLEQGDSGVGDIRFTNTTDTNGWFMGITGTEKFGVSRNIDLDAGNELIIQQDGKIGFGTATPLERIHLIGTGDTRIGVDAGAGTDPVLEFGHGIASGATWGIGLDASNSDAFSWGYSANGNPSLTAGNRMVLTTSGHVGIGTDDPVEILHTKTSGNNVGRFESSDATAYIQINDNADSLYVGNTGTTGFIGGSAAAGGNGIDINLSNGHVGIGTSTPSTLVEISDTTGGRPQFTINGKKTSDHVFGDIIFKNDGDSVSIISARRDGADDAGNLEFYTQPAAGSPTQRMHINSSGNVGVATGSPSETLHVAGAGRFDQGITYVAPLGDISMGSYTNAP